MFTEQLEVIMAMAKAYRGVGMDTKNTGRDLSRFEKTARLVAARVQPGSRVLEVAPGPGYLAIELARRGFKVTTVDISHSFVRIAQENTRQAGVRVDVRHGNASELPFADASFDFVVCVAAFKNFSDPVGAIDEMYRVLRPGGQASIFDLRKDATRAEIDAEVDRMQLSPWNAWLTRWTFSLVLLKRAYSRGRFEQMAAQSRFGRCEVAADGIGSEFRFMKA
jgi:ubiquinone/menaquinone biosynthesis C-methylase UbiE